MRPALLLFALALGLVMPLAAAAQQDPAALERINARLQHEGRARVIVELRLPGGAHVPEGLLSGAAATVQRQDIATTGNAVSSRIQPTGSKLIHRYQTLPFVALDIDAAGLAELKAAGLHVRRIFEDKGLSPALYQSGPLVQADQTAALGLDGSGWVVAIVDSGVDKTHPFLAGKVVSEACYVSGNGCPNGLSSQTGSGAAAPFGSAYHGTHVAGIAAGNGPNAVPPPPQTMSGIARGAQIIAINVFGSHAQALESDVIAALNRVYSLRTTLSVASVNVSLAQLNEPHTNSCDITEAPMKSAIDQLRSVNIATVISSGDDGFVNAISNPSCISSAISVGSTTKSDVVSGFSNVSTLMSLFAPGSNIYSSVPGGGYNFLNGTSMSAPHVAGAWAVLRQANPTATVSQILAALQSTGVPVDDTRSGGTVTAPRIEIRDAAALLAPGPSSVSPTSGALGTTLNVTINGNSFTIGSSVSFGAGITVNSVTFLSTTQLRANITISSTATPGPRTVTVTTNNGTVGSLPNAFTVGAGAPSAPTITSLSPSTVTGFGPDFTLTVNGTNFTSASVVQVNGSNRTTTFVSTTRLTALILASDLATSASSLAITVNTPGGGTSGSSSLTLSQPSLAVSGTTSPPGGTITATLSKSPGGSSDWLALAQVGTPATSYLQWTYVGAGVTTRTWAVAMPSTVGSYEFRLYLNNGYTVAAKSPAVAVANISPTPSITGLSPASVAAGSGAFTLTLTGTGFAPGATAKVGGTARTLTFGSDTQVTVAVTAADVANQGTAGVQVTNPAACVGGQCASNTASLTVTAPPPAPTLTSLSPASVGLGGVAFTLTATGSNFAGNSVVQVNGSPRPTTYVSPTQLTAAIPASDLTAAGALSVTVFTPAPGGGTSAARSLTIVGPGLGVSGTTALPGGTITATLSNSPGGGSDWLALAQVGTPTTSYLQWTYVGTGVTTRTWAVTMPATVGNYEFRLYLNNSYTVAATSPAVAVANISPTPSITGLNPASVAAGSGAFTLTLTGTGFAPGATATVGGAARALTFGSATQVTVAVTAADVANQGSVAVQITNPAACVGGQCASNTATLTVTAPPPAPTLTSLSPASTGIGGVAFTLTATGSNFAGNSVVQVNGSPRPSTYVSPTQLTATIPASDLTAAGALSVTVFTPAPGGGTSAARSLTIVGPGLGVSGTTALPGGTITATLNNSPGGSSDWLALAQVGTPATSYLQWTYVGAGVTTRTWAVTMPATVGSYEFRLYLNNSYTVAATSPAVAVANISPTPSITGLNPASVAAGSGAFTLTLTGTGFAPGATATVGGAARTVTFGSDTQVNIAVLAADVALGGPFPATVPVQVTNPAACVGGQCVSNTASLTVTAPPPPPTLTGLSPASAGVGGVAFTLTATGSNFAGNSVVQVNGSPRPTTYVSPTQLTATIPASDLTAAGALSVTVFTPTPGGGTSTAQSLMVVGPSLGVSGTTALPGGTITATLNNSPGGSTDWLALAQVGTPATSYLQWIYVGAGVTTRTWPVAMPSTVGSYEFRLYLNNGYTVAATSPAITVSTAGP